MTPYDLGGNLGGNLGGSLGFPSSLTKRVEGTSQRFVLEGYLEGHLEVLRENEEKPKKHPVHACKNVWAGVLL